ncbi:hypothetical protein ACOME3_004330 [Neoechinorhynchus agilis]
MRRVLGGDAKIGICDGSKLHRYQPGWTLAAVNQLKFKSLTKDLIDCLPRGVDFINQNAAEFKPDENTVVLENGQNLSYDCLVVTTGVQIDLKPVEGIEDALENDPMVFTIFDPRYVTKSYKAIMRFKQNGGRAIFSYPFTETFKCRGAAVKIMFLADDIFKKRPKAPKNEVIFVTSKDYLFSVQHYNAPLVNIANRRNIKQLYDNNLTSIDHKSKTITVVSSKGRSLTIEYDLLHYTPDMVSVPAVANSPLADSTGFVEVDKHTTQHVRYPNVFSIGDGSNLPTSKTLAAVASESKILFENVNSFFAGKPLRAKYNGYTACPLTTSLNHIVLAEFDYDKNPMETFPFDQRKESRNMFWLKKRTSKCVGYLPLYGKRIACCAPLNTYFEEGVDDCKFLCSTTSRCKVVEYNVRNKSCIGMVVDQYSCVGTYLLFVVPHETFFLSESVKHHCSRLLDSRSIGQTKTDANFNAYYKTECSSPRALKRPEVKTACTYRLFPRRKLSDKFIAVKMIGPRISMRLCKMYCDAVKRCLAFVYSGFKNSKSNQCHLARSISTDIKDSFSHELFVKRICTIDEKLATNKPVIKVELSTNMGDYIKVTKRPMKCFKVARNGTRTPTLCQGSFHPKPIGMSVFVNETKVVVLDDPVRIVSKAESKNEIDEQITDVIDIEDLNIDFGVFGLRMPDKK